MSCSAGVSSAPDAATMAYELCAAAKGAGFGYITCTVGVDIEALRRALVARVPGVPFVGVTSCLGVIGDGALRSGPHSAAALWFKGATKAAVVGRDISASSNAIGAELGAMAMRELDGTPSFALVHATPGVEAPLLHGLGQALPPTTAVLGGTAADDDQSGHWSVFTHAARYTHGAVLALVRWPGRAFTPWLSGALPTDHSGRVTKASGRTIYEIDGEPAAVVYDRWVGGALGRTLNTGGTVLAQTALMPLGVARDEGITLVHPERVLSPSRALSTFADVSEGEIVTLVRMTTMGMRGRPANIAARALAETSTAAAHVKGVLLVHGAGCMLSIGDQAGRMAQELKVTCGNAPVVGAFHFGEQGCHPQPGRVTVSNVAALAPQHGNLMTGMLLLA